MLPRNTVTAPADYDFNPDVYVERAGDQLVLKKCPHCGKTHYHGIGYIAKDDPNPYPDRPFGHRLAHCATAALPKALQRQSLGYVLVLRAPAKSL